MMFHGLCLDTGGNRTQLGQFTSLDFTIVTANMKLVIRALVASSVHRKTNGTFMYYIQNVNNGTLTFDTFYHLDAYFTMSVGMTILLFN